MARLLPGVYSAINDLSQMPEGAQSLNVGYVVKANRGPVGEFNLVTSPTDFLTKYTFSGQPSLTDDPTMHEIIKVMAQTNTMYVTRATNNPLYGGAIVKKAQEYGPILGVDQAEETFLLMVPVDDEGKVGEVPEKEESIILSGTGLFDGRYVIDGNPTPSGYEHRYYDEAEEKLYVYKVYEIKLKGEDPIAFDTEGLGYDIVGVGVDSNRNQPYFEIKGDIVEDFEAFDLNSEDAIITITGAFEEGSSGVDEKNNNGYYVVKLDQRDVKEEDRKPQVVLHEKEDEQGRAIYTTYVYIDIAQEAPFKNSIDDLVKGQLFINNSFKGTSTYRTPIVPLGNVKIGDIFAIEADKNEEGVTSKIIKVRGDVASKFAAGDVITVKGSPENEDKKTNDGNYTVVRAAYDGKEATTVVVEEKLGFSVPHADNIGFVFYNSLVSPEASYEGLLGEDDLFFIAGIDPGAYNGLEAFSIVSAFDNPDELVYVKGKEGLFPEPCPFDTMELTVYNAETNAPLESFTFSRDENAKTIDGISLFINDVVEGSAYIKVFNNPNNTDMPNSTLAGSPIQASGGSDGAPVTPSDLVKALGVFEDKTIPVSIMGNGCSPEAESEVFQQALLALASTRKDMFVFLNSPASKEKATIASTRAQDIVNYKKNNLASTSFYGCMYAPHVTSPDVFNSRNVKIGAGSVATAGWLNVINSLNYPYAYAGPRNGLVTGVTCDWKIGDMSGEAEMLNDASINYVAYDGRVGRYYMQCQNTLQVANSAMRNIGVVLNVLDIKETLVTYLKEFLNLPITDSLRRDIMDTVGDYLSPMTGVRFYNYVFQDTTTDADLAQDTLRYLLTLSPSRYAQRIYLVMNIVRTGFDFSILQSM